MFSLNVRARRSLASASLMAFAMSVSAEPLPSSSSYALDSMAPAGRWATKIELRANGYDQWYDNDGKRRDLDAAFDGVELNGAVFPSLALLGAGATLGSASIDTKAELRSFQLILAYGITGNLTAGTILPFVTTHAKVGFSVSGGNVGSNPAFDPGQPIGAANFPFAPVGGGAAAPLGTAGVKQLLTDPVYGYGYRPIENTTTTGLSDSTVGLLWRFHNDQASSAILGGGVRFGVAGGDDPDNLLDVPIGDGSTDIRLRVEYFRDLAAGFDLHLLAENFTQLPDHADMRVPQPGQPLATADSKERLRRNMGDYQEYDVELGRRWGDWRAAATWHLYKKGRDKYSSGRGTNTDTLEANTDVRADQWRAGTLPLPLILKLEMQETWGGRNFPDVRDFYLQAITFF
jgi:hypothetical protein